MKNINPEQILIFRTFVKDFIIRSLLPRELVRSSSTQAEKSVYCQSLQPARYRSGCNSRVMLLLPNSNVPSVGTALGRQWLNTGALLPLSVGKQPHEKKSARFAGTFSSRASRSIFCIHFSNFLLNYMIKIIYFLPNLSKRKNNRRLYLR